MIFPKDGEKALEKIPHLFLEALADFKMQEIQDITNVQWKPIQNCHNESPLYNEYILIKMGKKETQDILLKRRSKTVLFSDDKTIISVENLMKSSEKLPKSNKVSLARL
jgi:hypothetical protein